MTLQKNDFIEIEFTGKLKDGEVFDSNIKKDLEKAGLKLDAKPFVFPLGQGMFLKGIDNFLVDKEVDKEYELEIQPEDAFGNRDAKLIQRMPMKIFMEHKINPIQGSVLNFDGRLAKILSVSGGRVMVDFNNPLSGKVVVYKLKVLRKIEEINDKINSLNNFLFKKTFKFDVQDKKLLMEVEKPLLDFVKLFSDKFKEIFGLELELKEAKEEKPKEEKK